MNLERITSNDRILCVVPHPDDEAIGCSGVLHRAAKAGAHVTLVMCTDGNRRGLGRLRKHELAASLKAIGLPKKSVVHLELPDGTLTQNDVLLFETLTTLAKEFAPTAILATDPADRHPDHAIIGEWAWQMRSRKIPVYTFLAHHRFWPWPFGYKPNAKLAPPRAQKNIGHWVSTNMSETERIAKRNSIASHKSQHHILLRPLLLSFVRTNELYRKPHV